MGTRRHKPALTGLIALTLLALVLRYPAEHERGVDSFTIHALSGMITQTGSLDWLVSPLSYFGLAPFSYPPAVPISIAFLSDLSGLNIETAGLLYCFLLGAVAIWTAFLLGREVFLKDTNALLLALLMSMAGGLIAFTNWNLSARGTFLVFVPLILALFLKAFRADATPSKAPLVALLLVCVPLVFVHFLWLLLFPIILAAAVVLRIARAQDSLLRRRSKESTRSRYVLAVQALVAIGFLVVLSYNVTELFSVSNFPALDSPYLPDNLLTRLAVQYATTMGLSIVAFPVGLWQLSRVPERGRRYALTSLVVILVPLAADPTYGILLATSIFLAVATAGFLWKRRSKNPTNHRGGAVSHATIALLIGLALLLTAPYLVTVPRSQTIACNQPGSIDDWTYDTGLYLRQAGLGSQFSFASDDPLNAARIEAISGVPSVEPTLSIGTLGYPWLAGRNHVQLTLPDDPFNSLVTQQQLLTAREWISAASSSYGYFAGKHTTLLLSNLPDSAVDVAIRNAYNARFALQICPGSTTVFYASVDSSGYLVYCNEAQRIYTIP